MAMDPHYLECARAALAARIEGAKSASERKEMKEWLAEIEAEALADAVERRATEIYEDIFLNESVETASWAAALEHELTARIESCREQARRELG